MNNLPERQGWRVAFGSREGATKSIATFSYTAGREISSITAPEMNIQSSRGSLCDANISELLTDSRIVSIRPTHNVVSLGPRLRQRTTEILQANSGTPSPSAAGVVVETNPSASQLL